VISIQGKVNLLCLPARGKIIIPIGFVLPHSELLLFQTELPCRDWNNSDSRRNCSAAIGIALIPDGIALPHFGIAPPQRPKDVFQYWYRRNTQNGRFEQDRAAWWFGFFLVSPFRFAAPSVSRW